MPDIHPKVGNLSDLARDGRRLEMTCIARGCHHVTRIEATALLDRAGDMPYERINQALACPQCGGREFDLVADSPELD